jgi:hypothetical protein
VSLPSTRVMVNEPSASQVRCVVSSDQDGVVRKLTFSKSRLATADSLNAVISNFPEKLAAHPGGAGVEGAMFAVTP